MQTVKRVDPMSYAKVTAVILAIIYLIMGLIMTLFMGLLGGLMAAIPGADAGAFAGAGLLRGFAITTMIGVTNGVLITRPAFSKMIEVLLKDEIE